MKEFLSINEIYNRKCHIFHNEKTSTELVYDKLIMSLDELNSPNSPRQIYHTNYTIFQKKQLSWMTYFKIISRKH